MKKIHVPFQEYLERQMCAMNHPVHKARSERVLGRTPTRRDLHEVWVLLCAKFFARKYTYF